MKNLLWSICTTFLFVALAFTATAQDDNPKISIQGTLKDANSIAVDDGQQTITFRLYDAETGGTVKHEETGDVQVRGGVYNYLLGTEEDLDPAAFETPLYLSLEVNGNELFPRTPMTYSPYSLSVNTAQQAIGLTPGTKTCSGTVGDIKYSILNPTQFAMVNGDCWVPLDGGDMTGSALASMINTDTLPDMSGLFIRATEYNDGNDPGRMAMSDPTMQGDENKEHDHDYEDSRVRRIEIDYIDNTLSTGSDISRVGQATIGVNFHNTDDRDRIFLYNKEDELSTDPSGGPEARPKNMNFYIYIRID